MPTINAVKINTIVATPYGSPIIAHCLAGSIVKTACLRSGIPIVLMEKPKRKTTATIRGAVYIEELSHTSRQTDQEYGRVVDGAAGPTCCGCDSLGVVFG